MIKQVKVVIGSNYGDEGKGMFTDYLVRNSENPLVVRANGGSQCGHTVTRQLPPFLGNKKSYIFSHLGSGTLAGAPTLFTRNTVVSPIAFLQETQGRNASIPYELWIDPECPVTTPYDIFYNHILEIRRSQDEGRHGSVGCGFGTTLDREENGIRFRYSDLKTSDTRRLLMKILEYTRKKCGPLRETDTEYVKELYQYMESMCFDTVVPIFDKFLEDCTTFKNCTKTASRLHPNDYETLIFENGQGLLLDQEYGNFPHVTRSNTGFRNVGKFLKRHGLFNQVPVDIYYMSRCYVTKHGAGYLPHEVKNLSGLDVVDTTNLPHVYQGSLRYAPLNLTDILQAQLWDCASHPFKNTKTYNVVTCVDQVLPGSFVDIIGYKREVETLSSDAFLEYLEKNFDIMVSDPCGPK